MKKVLIADDHLLFGSGISSLFTGAGYQVVGTVEKGDDVLYKVISTTPDILILDLNMPRKNGLEVLKEVRDYSSQIIILVVTMYDDPSLIRAVKRDGGNAYFLKNCDQKELLNAAASLMKDDFYLSESVDMEHQQEHFNLVEEDEFSTVVKLTSREKEILKLLVVGLSSNEIGIELNISPETVKTHRKNMLKKLSFNKVSELVSYAFRNNLV